MPPLDLKIINAAGRSLRKTLNLLKTARKAISRRFRR
jgi:hypothetical protein